METSFEFLTTGKAGRGVQRHWPDEEKREDRFGKFEAWHDGQRRCAALWLASQQSLNLAAHDTIDGARRGKLILPTPEDAVEFTAVIVDPPVSELPSKTVSRPEIILGPVTIRLEEGASAARITDITRALMAAT